jgi:radical SAM superfamily enzyme YgiQ (UPF0313 family)
LNRRIGVLLINPYIYDVAAYGFWSAPLGLLYMGAILRKAGMNVTLLDCLTEHDKKRKGDGRAPFMKERVDNPGATKGLSKRFRRYGMAKEEVVARLAVMERPDVVLVTSVMTYWYTGAEEVVRLVRQVFPGSLIAVGGIYPALCEEHAERRLVEADLIVGANGQGRFYEMVEERQGERLSFKPGREDIGDFPYPAFDLYGKRAYVPLLTSVGCVYRCAYCATHYLRSRVVRREPKSVLEEIVYWNKKEVSRFALYDDSFLAGGEDYAKPLLRGIDRLPFNVSIYNPNALNAALIDGELAALLKGAAFQEVRLGLETADPAVQRATGGKLNRKDFERAVSLLLDAGFSGNVIQAYVLAGLPLQRLEDVKRTIDYAVGLGIKVNLAQYSPIPHTPMFEKYRSIARYPIAEEPLFQNNALFPFAWEGFTDDDMNRLKAYVREKNAEENNVSGPETLEEQYLSV